MTAYILFYTILLLCLAVPLAYFYGRGAFSMRLHQHGMKCRDDGYRYGFAYGAYGVKDHQLPCIIDEKGFVFTYPAGICFPVNAIAERRGVI